jgi:hypothetical protein
LSKLIQFFSQEAIAQNIDIENNHPIGENSPNLVTLDLTIRFGSRKQILLQSSKLGYRVDGNNY